MIYLIYKSMALNFAFRKLKLNMIYKENSNQSPFKYFFNNSISESFSTIKLKMLQKTRPPNHDQVLCSKKEIFSKIL